MVRWNLPIYLTLFFLAAGCEWTTVVDPDVWIIAVEGLGALDVSCSAREDSETDDPRGFQSLCDESVRFTRAFVPSSLSGPSLASLLTGLYPYQHGFRHFRGWMPAEIDTLAERALRRGYRTSFFGGGPPVFSRSGVAQGFEWFDDGLEHSSDNVARTTAQVFGAARQWLHDREKPERLFTVLYSNALLFPELPVEDTPGHVREPGVAGQLFEINRELSLLWKALRKTNRWDRAAIVLAGLGARDAVSHPPTDFASLSLKAERTQVALLIKPPRKKRDGPFHWKIDSNVSLADVGRSLGELIGDLSTGPNEKPPDERPRAFRLNSVLSQPKPTWNFDRPIPIESAWSDMRGTGGIRFAIRKGHLLYIHDRVPQLYDTLSDHLELSPLPYKDESTRARIEEFRNEMAKWEWAPFEGVRLLDVLEDVLKDRILSRQPEGLDGLLKTAAKLDRSSATLLRLRRVLEFRAGLGDRSIRQLGDQFEDACLMRLGDLLSLRQPLNLPGICDDEGLELVIQWLSPNLPGGDRTLWVDRIERQWRARGRAADSEKWAHFYEEAWQAPVVFARGPSSYDLIMSSRELAPLRRQLLRRQAARISGTSAVE